MLLPAGRRVRVVVPFRPPPCRFCAGHRGVVVSGTAGLPVSSVVAGVVQFVGDVAGVRWLVVRRADGLVVAYGRLSSMVGEQSVHSGQSVAVGQRVGLAGNTFYVGVRVGDRPVDPALVLGGPWWRSGISGAHGSRLVPGAGRPVPSRCPPDRL